MVAVIEWHGGGQRQQFAFIGSSGADRAAVPTSVVRPLRRATCQTDSGLVRACLTAGHPQHEERPAFYLVDAREWMVRRLYGRLAQTQQLVLRRVDPFGIDARRWKHGQTIALLDT